MGRYMYALNFVTSSVSTEYKNRSYITYTFSVLPSLLLVEWLNVHCCTVCSGLTHITYTQDPRIKDVVPGIVDVAPEIMDVASVY